MYVYTIYVCIYFVYTLWTRKKRRLKNLYGGGGGGGGIRAKNRHGPRKTRHRPRPPSRKLGRARLFRAPICRGAWTPYFTHNTRAYTIMTYSRHTTGGDVRNVRKVSVKSKKWKTKTHDLNRGFFFRFFFSSCFKL